MNVCYYRSRKYLEIYEGCFQNNKNINERHTSPIVYTNKDITDMITSTLYSHHTLHVKVKGQLRRIINTSIKLILEKYEESKCNTMNIIYVHYIYMTLVQGSMHNYMEPHERK